MTKYYDQAVALVNRSRYDLAERQLRRALVENPNHAASYSLLGICLARLDRRQEALAATDEGLRLDPTIAYAHYARGYVRVCARDWRKAVADMEEAIRIDPTHPGYHCLLGEIYSDLGQPEKSLAHAERGLEIDPQHTRCASTRATALQRLGRNREADAATAQALVLGPDEDFTHAARGWTLLQRKDLAGARRHFLEALRINPQNYRAHTGLTSAKEKARLSCAWLLVPIVGAIWFLLWFLDLVNPPTSDGTDVRLVFTFLVSVLSAIPIILVVARIWMRNWSHDDTIL
jgi:tetratricopeptide (TPR) repeat protein